LYSYVIVLQNVINCSCEYTKQLLHKTIICVAVAFEGALVGRYIMRCRFATLHALRIYTQRRYW